jgi:hypothetical protein
MKFFKHFTDAHRGQTLNNLFDRMGHMGRSCYWDIVEMCAEKLEKDESEEFTEAHCHFSFHEREIRKNLRVSPRNLRVFLEICAENSALSSSFSGKIIQIHMPKLLECLDRDSKRARQGRGLPAPKIKKKNKEIDFANLNWAKEAAKVAEMIKRHGNWATDEADIRAVLGDFVFDIARRSGIHKMRVLPSNQYFVSNIASMLKDTNDQLKFREAT